jgi:hypothetical protein
VAPTITRVSRDFHTLFIAAWLLCAVFYFIQYALRSAPGVMVPELTAAWNLNALTLSSLLGLYFFTYAFFVLVAAVACQLGKACSVGCTSLIVDPNGNAGSIAGEAIQEGDWMSLDGETGKVYLGQRPIIVDRPDAEIAEIKRWQKLESAR